MLTGETVVLERSDGTKRRVPNVLVAQTDATDITVLDVQTRFINQARYKGDTSTLTLCWPKADHSDLNDTHVWVRGDRYRVYSDPIPYDDSVCPTDWDRQVTALRSLFLYDIELGTAKSERDEWGVHHPTYEWRKVNANLLRLAGSMGDSGGAKGMEHLRMYEVPIDDYHGEVYVRADGLVLTVSDTASATDSVVMTCKTGVDSNG